MSESQSTISIVVNPVAKIADFPDTAATCGDRRKAWALAEIHERKMGEQSPNRVETSLIQFWKYQA
jgi:hypothetical protein